MKMVIVTLSCNVDGTEKSYDMEMPSQIAAKTLIAHICQTLGYYTEGRIRLEPVGKHLYSRRLDRVLSPDETLDEAGIWNGDHIDLK